MPVFHDQNKSTRSIVHANDIKSYEQLENKRTTVADGGKSAMDLATLAGIHAHSC